MAILFALILIFIHILCGNSMRDTKSRWQHSTSTISVLFYEVIDSFMNIRDIVFEKPKVTDPRFSSFLGLKVLGFQAF